MKRKYINQYFTPTKTTYDYLVEKLVALVGQWVQSDSYSTVIAGHQLGIPRFFAIKSK